MRIVAFSVILFCTLRGASGETDLKIPLEGDAEAKITASCCFNPLPLAGYAPIVIAISNDSVRAQRWEFHFQSPVFTYVSTDSMTFATGLEVPNRSTRSFKLLVPLASRGPDAGFLSQLGVSVAGYHANGASLTGFPPLRHSGKPLSAFVAISDSLASVSMGLIEKELIGTQIDLAATRFDPSKLPDDWRAFVGINALWMKYGEFAFLSSVQRGALHDWVLRGGSLFVSGGTDLDPQFSSTGFGKVVFLEKEALDVQQTAKAIRELEKTSLEHQLGQSYGSEWKAVSKVGVIKFNATLVIGFMAVFAILVGPINLFVFARGIRRYRLFWTTPLISVAASILLLLIIILQDGFGGYGSRVALVYVGSVEKRDVVLQEQIARTGVLLGSSFQTRDPTFIVPIKLGTPKNGRKRSYDNSDTFFDGEWFVSRALQPHWIESVAPSRAGVALLNSAEIHQSHAAPIIVSNINGALEQVRLRDDNGSIWSAENVKTGERVTLKPDQAPLNFLPEEAGPRLRAMWAEVQDRKNYFYAISRESDQLVQTLPSIRWKNDRVLFVGPVSGLP